MTEELTGQAALAAKLAAVIHEFCEDLPWKDSQRIGADAAWAAWNCEAASVSSRTEWGFEITSEGVTSVCRSTTEEAARAELPFFEKCHPRVMKRTVITGQWEAA